MLMPFLLMAQTTFYVNASHPNASDANTGTDPNLPWLTLNTGKWTEGCSVQVSPGAYTFSAQYNFSKNVTIEGTSRDEVLIQGMSDTDFAAGNVYSTRAFEVGTGYTVTFKNVTFKNYRLDPALNPYGGGVGRVKKNGTLIFNNVAVQNVKWQKLDGGAIYSEGTINFENSIFNNCLARKGGAIYARGVSTIKKCNFIDNSTIDPFDDFKFGAAIAVEPSTSTNTTAQLTIDSCYFDNNRADVPTKSKAVAGGAIALRLGNLLTVKATIVNSTFSNNYNYSSGSAIGTSQATTINDTAIIEMDIRNCTFINNTSATVSSGTTINLYGDKTIKYGGKLTMVNNTFLNNNNGNTGSKSITSDDHAIDFTFINNIFLDSPKANPEDESGVGVSISLNQSEPTKIRSVICRNNIIDKWGGSINTANFPEWMSATTNNQTGKYNDVVRLNTSLTLPSGEGVPYLKLQNNSIAIDAGLDSYQVNEVEFVPEKDVRGVEKMGVHKDVGAYEYDEGPFSGFNSFINQNKENCCFPNPFTDKIILKQSVKSIHFFDITGKKMEIKQNLSEINTSTLQKGFYIVKVELKDGSTQTMKMQKR